MFSSEKSMPLGEALKPGFFRNPVASNGTNLVIRMGDSLYYMGFCKQPKNQREDPVIAMFSIDYNKPNGFLIFEQIEDYCNYHFVSLEKGWYTASGAFS